MSPFRNLLCNALQVRRDHGIGLVRQGMEVLRLWREPGRLGPAEYYDYRLFVDSLPYTAKREFLGWRGASRLEFLNDRAWHALANDKLAFSAVMRAFDIPIPRTVAIYHEAQRHFAGIPCFGDKSSLARFLRANEQWPLFAKPVQGVYGKGAALLLGYDSTTDAIILKHSEPRPVEAFVDNLHNPGQLGHLFQEVLRPHPLLEAICGDRLSSVRVMTLYPESGAKIHRVIWKIPAGANITDNYQHGAAGNLIATVDPDTGISMHAVQGFGLDYRVVERHPDTGAALRGVALPQWDALKEIVLRGTRSMPGLRFQHWDVAFARDGPTALEVNLFAGGGTNISQVSSGRGLLDADLVDLVRSRRR